MTIEQAIERLACAVEQQGNNEAVAEIIRQRNEAQAQVAQLRQSRDYYEVALMAERMANKHLRRVINGLRGALKRGKDAKA